jgi:drug/metabolite transporter (DMT)-like permease
MAALPALLAVGASIGYGLSDVLAVSAVRRYTASAVALWAQTTGLVILLSATLVVRPEVSTGAIVWGALGGVLGATGILAFYTALQNGPVSVVVPVSATGVLIPLLGGLLAGESMPAHVFVGVVAIISGVMIIAFSQSNKGSQIAGQLPTVGTPGRAQPVPIRDGCTRFEFTRPGSASVVLSGVAAACFGTFYLLVQQATMAEPAIGADESHVGRTLLVALAVQMGALLVTVLAASRHTLECMRPNVMLLVVAMTIGALDVVADLFITYALSSGPVAVIGPLGSLDPVVAVIAAAFLLNERLDRRRLAGVLVCLSGILLVAI